MQRKNFKKQCKNIKNILDYLSKNSDIELIEKIYFYTEKLFLERYSKNSLKTKKGKKAGIQRNDLQGHFRVRGNKIYVSYKRKEFATGCDDNPTN